MRQKKEINIQVGANIQAARERARYTQEQLSEYLGITPNHLSAIERGASGASLEHIQTLCGLLGVRADDLIFGLSKTEDVPLQLVEQINRVSPEYLPQLQQILSAFLEVLLRKETKE